MSTDSVHGVHDLLLEPHLERHVPNSNSQTLNSELAQGRHNGLLDYLAQSCATGLPLLMADSLIAYGVGQGVRFLGGANFGSTLDSSRFALLTVAMFACLGLYPGAGLGPIEEFRRLTLACLYGALLTTCGAAWALADASWISLAGLAPWGLLACMAPASRSLARGILSRFNWWCQPGLVLGTPDEVCAIEDRLSRNRKLGVRAVGILDGDVRGDPLPSCGKSGITCESLDRRLRGGCFWVAASSSPENRAAVAQRIREAPYSRVLWVHGRQGRILPDNIRICTSSAEESYHHPLRGAGLIAKRAFDVVMSVAGGLILLPVFLVIAMTVKLASRGPIFYGTPRLGMGGGRFQMWKFRTMVPDAEVRLQQYLLEHPEERADFARFFKLRKDPRITPVGKWLRLLSLDELPQIWNVVSGDMSLVGPRPVDVGLRVNTTPIGGDGPCESSPALPVVAGLYDAKALEFRPGITGLWQISGRADTTQVDRMDLDCDYVENWSLWLDLYILLCTPAVVLRMEGAR